MKNYEQIDISGDVGLRVWGRDMNELFENAAAGLSELMTDISTIKETEEKEISLNADSYEGLLIQWLNELIYLFDTHGFTGRRFSVTLEGSSLKARASGGLFDPEVNERRLLIKAATYHGLSLKKNDLWEATIIFDI